MSTDIHLPFTIYIRVANYPVFPGHIPVFTVYPLDSFEAALWVLEKPDMDM